MRSEREILEATERCVSIVVYYRASRERALFADDVRSVARWVAGSGLSDREAEVRLLEPLQSELVRRYGVEVGTSLRADFLAAYRDARRSERAAPTFPIPHLPMLGHLVEGPHS